MSIDNISFISCAVEEKANELNNGLTNGNSIENHDIHVHKDLGSAISTDNIYKQSDEEQENIIPWRAQLRKTNSRLSLVG